MKPLILASASPRRQELMAFIGYPFEVVPSDFDESQHPTDLDPDHYVETSALNKARDVAARYDRALVIGADTIVVIDGTILNKPEGARDAAAMLSRLSGRTHQVYTGLALLEVEEGRIVHEETGHEKTDVRFAPFSEETVRAYLATGESGDKAGAYAIQGRGAVLIEGIQGDYFNVVGLPVFRLSRMLERFGLPLFGG
ncbi:MAG: septum formation inhibitor Maf [Armatimonadetes bacterium]|nr:septum formation inhibitor Maf [Armatimonadota bacterium]